MWMTPKLGIRSPSEYENPFWDSDAFRMTDLDDWCFANVEDKNQIVIGEISFDSGAGEASWSSTLHLVNMHQTGLITIDPDTVSIADGQFMYVVVPRPYQTGTLLVTVGSPPLVDQDMVPIAYRKGTLLYVKGQGAAGYVPIHGGDHIDGTDDIPVATQSLKGLMSAVDKLKVDDLTEGKVVIPLRNDTGTPFLRGDSLYPIGFDETGQRITVGLADKDDPAKRPAIALAQTDIPDGTDFNGIVAGLLTGFNTSSWALTDQLVLGKIGKMLRPPPTQDPFTGEVQNLASVARVHATEGIIVICIDGLQPVTADQIFALMGTNGTPSKTNAFVTNSDPRNTNARTPTAHKTSHQNGGGDELDVGGLSGVLSDAQIAATHAGSHQNGGGDQLNVGGLSGVLADAQTATAHAIGGSAHSASTLSELNNKISGANVDDETTSRPPLGHLATHTNGTDDIQNATAAQKGLATAAQIIALDELKGGGDTTLHSHTAANTPVTLLGSPTDNTNVQRTIDHLWSSAITEGMAITENPDGTVNIASGEAMLRSVDDNHGPLISCVMAAVNDMVLVDNKTNFIYADYNGGSPQYDSTDDIVSILYDHTKQVGHYCTRVGTNLDCLDVRDSVINFINHWNIRDGLINGYQKATGNVLSIDGTHHVLLSSGSYYILNVPIPMPEFDSNGETFTYIYGDGASDWNRPPANIIDYARYDDLSGTRQTATSSKFTAHWAYAVFNTPGRYVVMYGREEYASAAAALDAGLPPTAPPEIAANSTGTPIYKIIYQANGTLISIIPIEQETASGVASTLHDQMPGLKGGEFGVFYHQSLVNYNHETKGSIEKVDVNSATKTLQPGEKFLNVIYDGVVDIMAPDSELIIPSRSFTVSDIFRDAATVYHVNIWDEAGNLIRKINASGGQVFVMSDTTKWS